MSNNISKWKRLSKEKGEESTPKVAGHLLTYEVDGYIVKIQELEYGGEIQFILIEANFDLCDVANMRAKSVGPIFKQINTLFI